MTKKSSEQSVLGKDRKRERIVHAERSPEAAGEIPEHLTNPVTARLHLHTALNKTERPDDDVLVEGTFDAVIYRTSKLIHHGDVEKQFPGVGKNTVNNGPLPNPFADKTPAEKAEIMREKTLLPGEETAEEPSPRKRKKTHRKH